MSRIGKKPVAIPAGVTVTLDGQALSVKGPKGQLAWTVVDDIEIKHENNELILTPRADTKRSKAMWGLSRTLVANLVHGVSQGYEEVLELVGVGSLSMQLGYSPDVDVPPPAGITFAVPKQTEVRVAGIDKQLVGEVAARIRRLRPPEPYKGKGVRYSGEKVRRKEGKKK